MVRPGGFEPPASCASGRRSPPELQAHKLMYQFFRFFTLPPCHYRVTIALLLNTFSLPTLNLLSALLSNFKPRQLNRFD